MEDCSGKGEDGLKEDPTLNAALANGSKNMRVVRIRTGEIFSRTKVPGASYAVNQYVGCQHSCLYCYAKFMCKWKRYGKWGSWIEVKENAPDLVRGRLVPGRVIMSTVSDPYQPIEAQFELTRRILGNAHRDLELSILTKSPLVVRDVDFLLRMRKCEVGLTVNGFEGKVKDLLEPRAPEHASRIDALRRLSRVGIRTFVFISPVIPRLVDVESLLNGVSELGSHFYVELINARMAGSEFMKVLRSISRESYHVLMEKSKWKAYIEEIRRLIFRRREKISLILHNRFKMENKIHADLERWISGE